MKTISSLLLFIFVGFQSFSQSLEGEWKGTFTTNKLLTEMEIPFETTDPIKLYFKLNGDSTYTVYSYSKGHTSKNKDTIVVCKVSYQRRSATSLYLEETEVLLPKGAPGSCFQKMDLNIRQENNSTIMQGTWKSGNECNNSGKIKFVRKKK